MSKRRYTNMQVLLPTIEKMLESGKSHREIEAELGLEGDRPVHNLLKRQRKKAAKGAPKFRGRKPAKTLQEYKYENKRLKMEVKLLQDFLQSTERKWGQRQSTPSSTVTGENTQYLLCANSSGYPGVVTTALKSVWERRIAMLLWQRKSRNVSAGQIRPTAIDVYGSG